MTGSGDTVKICTKRAAFGAGKDHGVMDRGKGGFEMIFPGNGCWVPSR